MKQNEPDAQAVHCYVSAKDNALYVRDEFKDAAAMGLHLSTTAAGHFPQLLAIAVPGPFFFFGDVPDELPMIEAGKAVPVPPDLNFRPKRGELRHLLVVQVA